MNAIVALPAGGTPRPPSAATVAKPAQVSSATPDGASSADGQGNTVRRLVQLGQSVWIDGLDRRLIRSGQLRHLIEEDGVSGVTQHPAEVEKAINDTDAYDADIQRLAREGRSVEEIRDTILLGDGCEAADRLRALYERTRFRDGYVSVELPPALPRKTEAIVAAVRQLWDRVDRPNVMIQVPATVAGVSAVRQLLATGVNVDVTPLFDLLRYRGVLEAWVSGLDVRLRQKAPVSEVACVTGFRLGPADVLVDAMLEHSAARGERDSDRAWQLRGQTAVAQARLAYVIWQRFLEGFRFVRLREAGAQPLRLLWTGTGRRNPDYSDIKYVEPLIARDTVVNLSLPTLDAYREHGRPAVRIEEGLDHARRVLYELPQGGVELHAIAQRLEDEGLAASVKAHDALLNAVRRKCQGALRFGSAAAKQSRGAAGSGNRS